MAASGPPRWQRWLYVAAVGGLLLPLWTVAHVPTLDGPVHVYNAWVLHHLHDPALPHIERHFQLSLEPVPNWLVQGLLYVLLFVAAPAAAEKLLLSIYVLFFGAVGWWFAGVDDPRRRTHALLALLFAYNLTFQLGFYNFLFSVPLALLAVGLWWRWRERLDWRRALALNGVLLLCYFAHMVGLGVALLAISVLWLATLSRRRWRAWLLHPLALAPQLVLPLWYVSAVTSTPGSEPADHALRWGMLRHLHVVFNFRNDYLARDAVALLFAGLTVISVVIAERRRAPGEPAPPTAAGAAPRWSERHAFVLAAATVVGLFLVIPDSFGSGGFMVFRLALFPFLLVIPALTARLGRFVHGTLAVALAILLAWVIAGIDHHHRVAAAGVDDYLAGLGRVRPHTRLLALVYDRLDNMSSAARTHASSWMSIEKALVDWDNYQATTDYFPVRFRPEVARPDGYALDVSRYDAARYASLVDYLYLWHVPLDSPLRPRVRAAYRVVQRHADWQLWIHRQRTRPARHVDPARSAARPRSGAGS